MIFKNSLQYNNKDICIFGAGEMYQQVKPLLEEENIKIKNVFDDTLPEEKHDITRVNEPNTIDLLYCVGYRDMDLRYRRFKEIKRKGFSIVSYISKNSIISKNVFIDNGSIINQGVIIDNFVEIGECIFINIGCTISHHTKINNNVFIAPGVNIAGYVNVNEGAFIGTNATVIDHINVGEYSIVAAGAVVIEDVPPYSMVAGNPAKVKKFGK